MKSVPSLCVFNCLCQSEAVSPSQAEPIIPLFSTVVTVHCDEVVIIYTIYPVHGFQAKQAANFGCVGLILYTDPSSYTLGGGGVYPDYWDMPPTGVQRGTIKSSGTGLGDPLTPGYPAIGTCRYE